MSAETTEATITFPYRRSLGPVMGAFFTALTERRILGIRDGDRVLCPPLEWDPSTGAELAAELVEVGPAGTVESWCWVEEPTGQHPLDRPFAFATIRLDGASTAMVHAVDTGSIDQMRSGLRVAPRWREERRGHMTDIEAFVPGEEPKGGSGGGSKEPVEMMDYQASITYSVPRTTNVQRSEQAALEGRILGQRCSSCGRTYFGGRGYCPVDSVALREEDEVDLPQTGVISNYTIITPVQYPGQTETEPFARVHVLLDDSDVVLSFQPVVDLPTDVVRVGVRVAASWGPLSEEPGAGLQLLGWRPTGEPDVEDPELVNRIH